MQDNVAALGCGSDCGAHGAGIEYYEPMVVDHSTVSENTINGACAAGCGAAVAASRTVAPCRHRPHVRPAVAGGCNEFCAGNGGVIENSGRPRSSTPPLTTTTPSAAVESHVVLPAVPSTTPGGTLTVINTTISDNSAAGFCFSNCVREGRGIANGANGSGGTLTLTNSTLSGNSVATGCSFGCGAQGGGLFNASTAYIGASIIAGSGGGNGGDCSLASPIHDLGYNLDDDGTCFSGPTDQPNTPAGLDPGGLHDNGGPTNTIALVAGSAAIDKVAASLCPATDQRGSNRLPPATSGPTTPMVTPPRVPSSTPRS